VDIKDNPSFLLFVEPTSGPSEPIIDEYTRKITGALRKAEAGISGYGNQSARFKAGSGYRGSHNCSCECARSSNQDYLLKTNDPEASVGSYENNSFFIKGSTPASAIQAVITNSLCIHYVACHRKDLSEETLRRILLLDSDEAEPTVDEISFEKKKYEPADNLRKTN
jgi:hypothetical protein